MGSTKCIRASSILSKKKEFRPREDKKKKQANTFVLLAIRTHFSFSVFHVGSVGLFLVP